MERNNFTFFLPHNIHNVGYVKQLQAATGGITSRRVFTIYWYAEESVHRYVEQAHYATDSLLIG